MSDEKMLSRTIRIDLIPDVPTEPAPESRKKRVVIATSLRKPTAQSPTRAQVGRDWRYQELLQSIYDATLVAGMDGKILEANIRATDYLLFSREELESMNVLDIISGSDATLISSICGNLENERHTLIQAYCVRKDGTFFPAEIAVNRLRLTDGGLCFFIRDITLRRQAEEMLRTEHNAIQNAGNGIAVVNLDACLEYINPAIEKMWGLDQGEEFFDVPVVRLFSDQAQASKMVAELLNTRSTWTGELVARRKNGSEFFVQVSATRNRNADGELVGIVFSFVDSSDRKRAEEAMREAERNRVVLESLGAACHHLGQPATILQANLELLNIQLAGSDESVQNLIKSSMENMDRLGEILHKLHAVNQYQTSEYLGMGGPGQTDGCRIIKI